MGQCTGCQLPLCADHLGYPPSALSDHENFAETTTTFKVPTGTDVGNYPVELVVLDLCFLHKRDQRLGANKCKQGLKHDRSPRVRIRMISNPRLILAIGDDNVINLSPTLRKQTRVPGDPMSLLMIKIIRQKQSVVRTNQDGMITEYIQSLGYQTANISSLHQNIVMGFPFGYVGRITQPTANDIPNMKNNNGVFVFNFVRGEVLNWKMKHLFHVMPSLGTRHRYFIWFLQSSSIVLNYNQLFSSFARKILYFGYKFQNDLQKLTLHLFVSKLTVDKQAIQYCAREISPIGRLHMVMRQIETKTIIIHPKQHKTARSEICSRTRDVIVFEECCFKENHTTFVNITGIIYNHLERPSGQDEA